MADQLFLWNASVLGCFAIAWLIQIVSILRFFLRAAAAKDAAQPSSFPPVTVVVCARNEEKNLMDHIPLIMEQEYPEFELVIVNDSSWDNTEDVLKALVYQYPKIHVISLDEDKQNMKGKKFALTLGIKAAKYDTVLLTDADCVPTSTQWIRNMAGGFKDKKELVLGFSSYRKTEGWLNRLIRFDTLNIALSYLGMARAGMPYMGVGRNLAYTKNLFFSVGGFKSHYSIASGDDDLFVNQVATPYNTAVVVHPDGQTVSAPKRTWAEWFQQKRRHFTTAPFYKRGPKSWLLLWPVSFFLLWAAFVAAIVLKIHVLVLAGIWILRYLIYLFTLHKASVRWSMPKDIVWLSPLLEFQLHLTNLGLYIVNLIRKPQKWN
jgi:glycosyltransferase involved in cell wall biosynthesis